MIPAPHRRGPGSSALARLCAVVMSQSWSVLLGEQVFDQVEGVEGEDFGDALGEEFPVLGVGVLGACAVGRPPRASEPRLSRGRCRTSPCGAGADVEGADRARRAAAVLIDLLGTFTAHPTPGRTTRTARLPFDAEDMLERMRLFLVILLGETILTLGRAISGHYSDALTLLMALGGFIALVRSVHTGINVIYGVLIGLVMLAAGIEIGLAHAHDHRAGVSGVLVLTGPRGYLLSQATYFRV
jgi:hypothetical protein